VNRTAIIAYVISLAGAAIWVYGYFVTGQPSLVEWRAYTPWWVTDFLPDLQTEIGMALACAGTILCYWPPRR